MIYLLIHSLRSSKIALSFQRFNRFARTPCNCVSSIIESLKKVAEKLFKKRETSLPKFVVFVKHESKRNAFYEFYLNMYILLSVSHLKFVHQGVSTKTGEKKVERVFETQEFLCSENFKKIPQRVKNSKSVD